MFVYTQSNESNTFLMTYPNKQFLKKMQEAKRSNIVATGLAIFAMFFGAGNIVFPLAVGQITQGYIPFAIIGLLITGVVVPFLGLVVMSLFKGNYVAFFGRIGPRAGFLLAVVIMGLIGPFGAIPRCITLAYSTLEMFITPPSLPLFSLFSCLLIFIFSFQAGKILDLLGYILTPLLLISLGLIVFFGFWNAPEMVTEEQQILPVFFLGLKEGYQTMDLLGAFFFSSVVMEGLREDFHPESGADYKRLLIVTLKACTIGALLLALTYIGFSWVAALHSDQLAGYPTDKLLGGIAHVVLGSYAGLIASIATALACLTTAIALAAVFAEFLQRDISCNRLSYPFALTITLIATYSISILKFEGIAQFLTPILQICYPALIVLSLLNLFYKLHRFQPVKALFGLVLLLSFIAFIIEHWN